jgi:hypothetical protein
MRNDYQYIDADYIYTGPRTGVLRNLGGIANRNALVFAETFSLRSICKKIAVPPNISFHQAVQFPQ